MKCYLLVGGLSSRMGAAKSSLVIEGRTFEERVVAAARAAFDEVIAIDRPDAAPRTGVRVIVEAEHEGRGAIFGLQRALADAGGDSFWLLAIDYPLITAALLNDLRRRFEASPAATMLIPWWNGEPQMLCGGYSAAVGPRVAEAIRSGDLRLRSLLGIDGVETVPEAVLRAHHEGEPLLNVNRPEDLERARRIHERVEPSGS